MNRDELVLAMRSADGHLYRDERIEASARVAEQLVDAYRAELRAKVEALLNGAAESPDQGDDYTVAAYQEVLDLIDGGAL